jgi:hypothetical protein
VIAPQVAAPNCALGRVSRMHLKHVIRQVVPGTENLRNDRSPFWNLEGPLWRIDAVGRRSQHQSRSEGQTLSIQTGTC